MNGSRDDRRVRKTKKALRDGLAKLTAEKNIREISVRELTDLVDLNRATFYLHYRDIHDLQQKIEDEVIRELSSILDDPGDAGEADSAFPQLEGLLRYIGENDSICRMLLGGNSGRTFLDKLCTIVNERCLQAWLVERYPQGAGEALAYFSTYVVYGYVAAIAKWVEGGMLVPPGEMANMLGNMGVWGAGFFARLGETGTEGEQR